MSSSLLVFAAPGAGSNDFFNGYSHEHGLSRDELHWATKMSVYSSDSPSITILVHGQGGKASAWSNNSAYQFVKNNDSIIESLSQKAGEANLYWAYFELDYQQEFKLYNLNNFIGDYEENDDPNISLPTINKIENISKHTIIVFQASEPDDYHRNVYEELHTLIDKVSYDFLVLTGKLPTINLISHSRGGLTSMMYATGYYEGSKTADVLYGSKNKDTNDVTIDYFETVNGKKVLSKRNVSVSEAIALGYTDIGDGIYELNVNKTYANGNLVHDHPYNVYKLYSMGSPYTGTDWDTMFFSVSHMILGESFGKRSAKNILDEKIHSEIKSCWESAVSKNSTLKLHAIAGEMNPNFLVGMIWEEFGEILAFAKNPFIADAIANGASAQEAENLWLQTKNKYNNIIEFVIKVLPYSVIPVNTFITQLELSLASPLGSLVSFAFGGQTIPFYVTLQSIQLCETIRLSYNLTMAKLQLINTAIQQVNNGNYTNYDDDTIVAIFADLIKTFTDLGNGINNLNALIGIDYNVIGSWGDLFISRDSQMAAGFSNGCRFFKCCKL